MVNRKVLVCLLLIITIFTIVSCKGEPKHECEFDSTTLACSCGKIKDGVVAYIGSSYENATVRFLTLQDAADYVRTKPQTKDITATVVYGKSNAEIECSGLAIGSSTVEFDLHTNTVSFTGTTGISINASKAIIKIGTVDGNVPVSISNSSLDLNADLTCDLTLNENANLRLSGDDVVINSLSCKDNVSVTLNTDSLTVLQPETAKKLREILSEESTSDITVTGHQHNYDSTTLTCSCGLVKDGVIAYVGTSYEKAKARFTSLQEASDYAKTKQATYKKNSGLITVYGLEDEAIMIGNLSVEDSNVSFDLSKCKVTLLNNAKLSATNSKVILKIDELDDQSSSDMEINSSAGELKISGDLTFDVTLSQSSKITFTDGDIEFADFTSDNSSTVTLNCDSASTDSVSVAKAINDCKTDSSTIELTVNNHSHSFDPVSGECECGKVNGYLYIGSSFKNATARFESLEEALNYIGDQQSVKTAELITVKGVSGIKFTPSSLSFKNCNVVFDLSTNTVDFDSKGSIEVDDSNVQLIASKISNLSSDISVKSGSLTLDSNLECSISLTDKATLKITQGSVTIDSFTCDNDCSVFLTTNQTVNVKTPGSAKAIRSVLDNSSTSEIIVPDHVHNLASKYNENETLYWQECTTCGYCTEKTTVSDRWVSMFYLDMANLSALVDIEEIIKYTPNPENVTIYFITGGGSKHGLTKYGENQYYYNPYYKYLGSYEYPNLVKALENGGDTRHRLDFFDSTQSNCYQYWKFFLDSNGKGSFIKLSHSPLRLMSDGWVLKDFVNFVYNLEKGVRVRYILHLWNHGGGNMWGMMQDFTSSSYPIMSMKDMDDSLTATQFVNDGKKFDIILFDMCEMQQIETMNMVKDYASCMIGSENTTYASCLGSLYYYANKYPSASIEDVATYFVEKTDKKQGSTYGYDNRTWSALDLTNTSKINSLNQAFNGLMTAVASSSTVNFDSFTTALANSVDYKAYTSHDTNSYDICSFASKFGYSSLSQLQSAVNSIVICNKYGSGVAGTTGLAFFFDPDIKDSINTYGTTNFNDYVTRAQALYPNYSGLVQNYYDRTRL